MKRSFGSLQDGFAFTVALSGMAGALACSSVDRAGDEAVRREGQDVIKGFAASGAEFDAVGSIGVVVSPPFGGPSFYSYFCSASVIGPRTVVTAKHCLDFARQVQGRVSGMAFAVGPSADSPARLVPIVDGEGAPGDTGGNIVAGTDVAVFYTAEDIGGITPLAFAVPKAADVGTKFVLMGYGAQDNQSAQGTRRAGGATLKGLEGKLYEIIFGSFERFREYALTGNGRAPALSPSLRIPPGLTPARVPRTEIDGGGATDVDATDERDPFDDGLREIYDTTLLNAGYEAIVGLGGAEAQACFGDSGGPLLRLENGKLVIDGVTSGGFASNQLICDFGAIYATFGPGVLEFLQGSLQFDDPCGGLTVAGQCDGNVARRCTKPFGLEGPRQPLAFDCSLLGATCSVQPDGSSGCGTH